MAGYSGTPLPRKLGIAEGRRVAFSRAPDEFRQALGPLPDGVAVRTRVRRPLDLIVAFFTRRSELERRFSPLASALEPNGGLWIAWPKRSSGVATDLNADVVRQIAIANGMVDKQGVRCAGPVASGGVSPGPWGSPLPHDPSPAGSGRVGVRRFGLRSACKWTVSGSSRSNTREPNWSKGP